MTKALTVAEVLNAAADLLERPNAWAQWIWAKGANGQPVWVGNDEKAVCWCIEGAFERIVGHRDFYQLRFAARDAFSAANGDSPIAYNDAPGRTQSEVVAALRRAAQQATAGGGE